MRDADLTHTVHAAVARLAERILDRYDASPGRGFRYAPRIARDDTDPDLRRGYAMGANAGWITLCGICVAAMLVVGYPVRFIFGETAGNAVAGACLAAGMFCVAGSANVLWRMYWYVPQARRRARKDGIDSKRFATSMRRTLPRNSSLIFQTGVAILTLILAL
jgi:hypothetical protein